MKTPVQKEIEKNENTQKKTTIVEQQKTLYKYYYKRE